MYYGDINYCRFIWIFSLAGSDSLSEASPLVLAYSPGIADRSGYLCDLAGGLLLD